MRMAVLDIGSNTAHLVVMEGRADGTFTPIDRQRELLRLADAAFPSMVLPDEAADRLVATVTKMHAFAHERGADTIVAFATSAIREATNGMDTLARVRAETGVPVQVLPGAEEGRLTYVAARRWTMFSARQLLVLDIGGGSLEVAGGTGERPEIADSLPLGATRLTRRFMRSDPPDPDDLASLRVHALTLLGPLAEQVRSREWDVVCATSKTFRTLGNVAEALSAVPSPSQAFGFAGIDGSTAPVLTAESVNLLAGFLAKTSAAERGRLKGLNRLRAGNVVAGSQIAALAMQAFGLERLVLAPWALREGLVIEYLARNAGGLSHEVAEYPRLGAVVEFARRYAWDEAHCRHVTRLALSLFDQTAELHGLSAPERELLEYASLLHDVGGAVAQSARHKHSLYIIRNAELAGFSQRELLLMANIARYHRKALPAEHHDEYVALDDDDRRVVRRLGALLRVADGLDLDHFQVVDDVRVRQSGATVELHLHARDEPRLSLWGTERNADLFEAEFQRRLRPLGASVA
jgi:exopolyphosphatase/guanosine-5'-triphosphate,3'-diphosphate pyrophosphatase